ncbi:ABC transporter ATP-binding protein [Paenibacillus methanolicus]|uniref:ABC-2 type transport system ATP-binding protein n=1 Tax=Paenibacillus methanolicus TaxID=582686 RepID=A0A5S5CHA5_9BACL|nr:ATP-binding cassette domain-containing protein [Paenibacillus methanolicus]TYP79176.1 ABC-2 type transport system ATP-binding protein [Paenibacillus methanolicus]
MEPVMEVRQVAKRYPGGRGVANMSMQVGKAEVWGLFGPNGAGKTTLLKILTGLCHADAGSVKLFGHDIKGDFASAMSRASCLIETADAYEYMSAERNLKLVARFYPGLPDGRIDEVLELVGLARDKRRKVSGYSLGMKQRLAIAAALLARPELIILDEPTNGLDIEGILWLRGLISRLAREEGTSFLISSHGIQEMEQVCTHGCIIAEGEIIRQGTVAELTHGGVSLEAAYIAAVNRPAKGERKRHA